MVQYLHDSVIHTNELKFSHNCQLTVLISLESSIGFTDSYLHCKLGPNCVVLLQLYWIFSVEKNKYERSAGSRSASRLATFSSHFPAAPRPLTGCQSTSDQSSTTPSSSHDPRISTRITQKVLNEKL